MKGKWIVIEKYFFANTCLKISNLNKATQKCSPRSLLNSKHTDCIFVKEMFVQNLAPGQAQMKHSKKKSNNYFP